MNQNIEWVDYVTDREDNPILLPTHEDIISMEKILDVHFPDDYKEVLLEHQGQIPNNMCVIDGSGNSYAVGALLHVFGLQSKISYGVCFIRNLLKQQDGINFLIPIFDGAGSSTFCLDYRGTVTNPRVVYFYIDYHDPEDPDTINDAVKVIAGSFTEFLDKLVLCHELD